MGTYPCTARAVFFLLCCGPFGSPTRPDTDPEWVHRESETGVSKRDPEPVGGAQTRARGEAFRRLIHAVSMPGLMPGPPLQLGYCRPRKGSMVGKKGLFPQRANRAMATRQKRIAARKSYFFQINVPSQRKKNRGQFFFTFIFSEAKKNQKMTFLILAHFFSVSKNVRLACHSLLKIGSTYWARNTAMPHGGGV